MNFKEWVEKEVDLAIAREKEGEENPDDPMLEYAISILESAKKLALVFSEQGHSGMSASFTKSIFNNLVDWKPLTPLLGGDDEWGVLEYDDTLLQNKRCLALFKYLDDTGNLLRYGYNDIIDVVNDDLVWSTYPPQDEPGSLDDDHPDVKLYFSKRKELKDKLNSEIKFPYVPITHKYKWNFETKEFELIK